MNKNIYKKVKIGYIDGYKTHLVLVEEIKLKRQYTRFSEYDIETLISLRKAGMLFKEIVSLLEDYHCESSIASKYYKSNIK